VLSEREKLRIAGTHSDARWHLRALPAAQQLRSSYDRTNGIIISHRPFVLGLKAKRLVRLNSPSRKKPSNTAGS
jgi:hypothetical protein